MLLSGMLVPILAVCVLSTIVVGERWSDRNTSRAVEHAAEGFAQSLAVIGALAEEQALSTTHVLARQFDPGAPDAIAPELAAARARVDRHPVPPSTHDALGAIRAIRADVDDHAITFEDLSAAYETAADGVVRSWRDQMDEIERMTGTRDRPHWFQMRMQTVREAVEMLATTTRRIHAAIEVNLGSRDPDTLSALFDANRAHHEAMRRIHPVPGSAVEAAVIRFHGDPAAQSTEASIAQAEDAALGAGEGRYASGVNGLVDGLANGPLWAARTADIAVAAADDLRADARAEAADDTTAAFWWLAAAATTLLLATAVGVLTARRLATPAHDLAAAARRVADGDFDAEPVPLHGPRELGEAIIAFNDMTATLSAVEAKAVALADDHESPAATAPLPGRTGQALQAALDRLHRSVAEAEQHRARLAVLATHDELTGLLNRRAALDAVDRDLHRARRDGTAVGVLYVDLDGLKAVNDRYGHAAGDDALRQCAEALSDAARAGDVVARLGGDEFLISAIVDRGDRDALTALGERVRQRVGGRVIAAGESLVPLRCSVGVALCDDASTDASGLIAAADTALYAAKTAGRNRTSW